LSGSEPIDPAVAKLTATEQIGNYLCKKFMGQRCQYKYNRRI